MFIVEVSREKFLDWFKVYSIYSPYSSPKTVYKMLCSNSDLKYFFENGMKCFSSLEIIFSLNDYSNHNKFNYCEKGIPDILIDDWRYFEFPDEETAFYFKLKFC